MAGLGECDRAWPSRAPRIAGLRWSVSNWPVVSRLMSHVLPPADYYASLPRHIAGAGCVFLNRASTDQVLLVKPSYRPDGTWEIPGGGLEEGEDPWQAACREIAEELGLEITPGRLLAVDWVPAQPDGRPALANYLFDGGLLSAVEAEQQIRLDPGELSGWRFASPGEWTEMLPEHMVRRVRACVTALADGGTACLRYGWPPEGQ